jgi:hypothetical protein
MSRHQNAGQDHGLILTNNDTDKSKLCSQGNKAPFKFTKFLLPFSQNLPSFCLLSKYLKMKIYKAVILPAVLYGCETYMESI